MEVAPPSEAVAVPSRHGETGPNPGARHRIVQHVRGSQRAGVGVQRMANRRGVTEICMPRQCDVTRMRGAEMARAAKVAAAEMSPAEMAATKVATTKVAAASTVAASTAVTAEASARRRGRKHRRKQDNDNP